MPGEEPLNLEPFRHTDVERESSPGHRMSPTPDAGPHTPRKKGFGAKMAAALHLPGSGGKGDDTTSHEPQRVTVEQIPLGSPIEMLPTAPNIYQQSPVEHHYQIPATATQLMESAPRQPMETTQHEAAALPQDAELERKGSPQGTEMLPGQEKYPHTMDRSVESLMMPVEDLAPLVQSSNVAAETETQQPTSTTPEASHQLDHGPQGSHIESEPLIVPPLAPLAPLARAPHVHEEVQQEELHTDTGPVKEDFGRAELGSIFTGPRDATPSIASTNAIETAAATAGTTTASESDSVHAAPLEKWPSSPPVTPTRTRSPELEEIPETAPVEFKASERGAEFDEASRGEGGGVVGSALPAGEEIEGSQEVGQLFEAPPPAGVFSPKTEQGGETFQKLATAIDFHNGEGAGAGAVEGQGEVTAEEREEVASTSALERELLLEESQDASEMIQAPPPTPQPSLDYSRYSPRHSEDMKRTPVSAPLSHGAEKTGVKGAEQRPVEESEFSPISEAPLGRPSEPLVLPFMEVPEDISPGELPVSNRRPTLQWAMIELYSRPLFGALFAISVYVVIRMAWAAAPSSVQEFGPALAVSGALAVAATIAAAVFARGAPLLPMPATESEMRSLDEASTSPTPGTSEPVSMESTEDLRHQHRGELKAGAVDLIHGVEHAAEGAYEGLMEAIDPGKEMVGDVIQEEEEGGGGAAAVPAMAERTGREKGPFGGGISEEESVSGVARMQGAVKEGGYNSDSDAPGPVIEGVHVQGRN